MIKCTLDEDECIDLLTVLRVINQINQEQAWAICYQMGAMMQRLWPANCAPIEGLGQIQLHKDGFVHEKSCTVFQHQQQQPSSQPQQHQQLRTNLPTPPITPELRRRLAVNESELVASLGIALFLALDYGIPDDEERKLSIAMEYLIFQSQSELSLKEVIEICINRLPIATRTHADSHYKEVCRTLINDTIELSIFLEKIYTASMVLSDITLDHKCDNKHLSELGEPLASLRALRINDWARLWMQVIRELRQRGKFKAQATQLSVS